MPWAVRTAARAAIVASNAAFAALGAPPAVAQTFTNPNAIVINATDEASPYPSTILVSGVAGSVSKVRVALTDLSHAFPADIDMLLVGPGGQNLILMSDVGGSIDIAGVDLVFDDAAAGDVLIGMEITSGTYKPTDVSSGEIFPAPAPAVSGATTLATFNGTNPNGIWSLFIQDDAAADAGSLGGWSITFVPEATAAAGQAAALLALLAIRRWTRSCQ